MVPCFNTVDLALVGAMGVTALIGLSRGFIRELASILAWVLAGVVTFWDIPILQALMKAHLSSAFMADVVAGLLVFVIAFAIVSLVGTLCANFIRGATVSPVDRLFGVCLGAAKGFFLLGCIELMVVCFLPRSEMPEMMRKSFLMPFVAEISDGIRSVLPKELQVFLDEMSSKNTGGYSVRRSDEFNQPDLSELPAPSVQDSEPRASVDDLVGHSPKDTSQDAVQDLAVLAPKPSEDPGGVYTLDQKATLENVLGAESNPVGEEPVVGLQDPFSQEARETAR